MRGLDLRLGRSWLRLRLARWRIEPRLELVDRDGHPRLADVEPPTVAEGSVFVLLASYEEE